MVKIKKICQQLDFLPQKNKGQNFLSNEKILDDIIGAAEIKPNDIILEIGPGLGILTEVLAKKAESVIAVELDKKLALFLKEKFINQSNVEIIQGDILKIKNLKKKFKNFNYKLVANIPYNITGAVLRKFLSEEPKPNLMILMVQKEVAQRIMAKNKKNSIVSLMVAFFGKPEIIRLVSKNNFWPRPKIDSAILKIAQIKKDLPNIDFRLFFNLIKIGFSSPRKQLLRNLVKIKNRRKIMDIFRKAGLNYNIRAEDLILDNWFSLYYHIYNNNNK